MRFHPSPVFTTSHHRCFIDATTCQHLNLLPRDREVQQSHQAAAWKQDSKESIEAALWPAMPVPASGPGLPHALQPCTAAGSENCHLRKSSPTPLFLPRALLSDGSELHQWIFRLPLLLEMSLKLVTSNHSSHSLFWTESPG